MTNNEFHFSDLAELWPEVFSQRGVRQKPMLLLLLEEKLTRTSRTASVTAKPTSPLRKTECNKAYSLPVTARFTKGCHNFTYKRKARNRLIKSQFSFFSSPDKSTVMTGWHDQGQTTAVLLFGSWFTLYGARATCTILWNIVCQAVWLLRLFTFGTWLDRKQMKLSRNKLLDIKAAAAPSSRVAVSTGCAREKGAFSVWLGSVFIWHMLAWTFLNCQTVFRFFF